MPTERELRAQRRQSWPGGLTRAHEPAQLSTPEERLASMWQGAAFVVDVIEESPVRRFGPAHPPPSRGAPEPRTGAHQTHD